MRSRPVPPIIDIHLGARLHGMGLVPDDLGQGRRAASEQRLSTRLATMSTTRRFHSIIAPVT
jgi:hypothetical protein